jgi:hypothetical protein
MYYYFLIKDYIIKIYQLKWQKRLKNLSKQVNLFYSSLPGETLMYIEARGFNSKAGSPLPRRHQPTGGG